MMGKMFGERINQFVLSFDIMSEDLFYEILRVVSTYLKDELGVQSFSLLGVGQVNGRLGLNTIWSTSDVKPSYTIKRFTKSDENKYTSFSGYVFENGVPLWVVKIEKTDGSKVGYKNYWDDHDINTLNFQEGVFENQIKFQTLVVHPIIANGTPFGVIEFSMPEKIVPRVATKKEITLLAQVISRAYKMYTVHKTHGTDSKIAIQLLEKARDEESWYHLGRVRLFIAFSGGLELADELKERLTEVTTTIDEVLQEDPFPATFEIIKWDKLDEAGNITNQLMDTILNSDYGIVYLSEPAGNEKNGYQDNPNVLFEAGMMQALTLTPGIRFKGWIPIREKEEFQTDGQGIPFDISTERLTHVERDRQQGFFKKQQFKELLNKRLLSLLDDDDSVSIKH